MKDEKKKKNNDMVMIVVAAVVLIGLVIVGYFATRKPSSSTSNTNGATGSSSSGGADSNSVAPVTDKDWVLGNKAAKVTIVEYADYQCPACAYAATTLVPQIEDYYKDNVRIIYRNFPLSYHPNALPGAYAAEAAGSQGKFWEMNKVIFENQNTLEKDSFDGFAKQLGLDIAKFDADRNSQAVKDKVAADQASGEALNLPGTPSFYINGALFSGNLTLDDMRKVIDPLL